jgi:Flp pilus assembly pilin Flp
MLNPASPLGFLLAVLDARVHRARSERGASAVEWVIIAAIVVGICIAVAGVLRGALTGEANEISNEIQQQ